MIRHGVLWVFLMGLCLGALGHSDPRASVPALEALRVDAPLTVDGVLDEPFWSQARSTGPFVDQRTQQPENQPTRARVAYTQEFLYLAVECFDDHPDEIRATERHEDREFTADDWVEVHLDPTHSHQSKYAFFANPLGTRADANEGPSGEFNRGWSADWDCAARITTNAWVFEMRIPFSILNYFRANGQTWGLNFTRALRRTDTTSFWSFNATDVYKPRHFGHLTGLDLADTKFNRNWEVSPYVSAQVNLNGDTDTLLKTGMDVSFRLTPSVTTAWTLNPDYGQVEADADTIELLDTERFLPEKRPFFREGDELMRMTHLLYYSRRFTDIDGGAKTSGEWKGFKFMALDLLGDVSHDTERYGNSAVVRVLQNVRERSTLGYYLADSEFEEGFSRVLSTDGYLFLSDAWRVRYQVSGVQEQGPDIDGRSAVDQWDYLGSGSLIYDLYPWEFGLTYNAISDEFNPVLGYIPRRDIFGPSFYSAYDRESGQGWYKRIYLSYDTQFYLNQAGQTALRDHSLFGRVVFPNDFGFKLGQDFDYHVPYHNDRTSTGISLFTSDYWKYVGLNYALGTFEEMDYHEIGLSKNFKPLKRWPINWEAVLRFEDYPAGDHEVAWLNRIVFDFYLRKNMWIKTSLQHRDDNLHNLSVIYGWEFRRNSWFYFVVNDVRDETHDGTSLFTKVVYSF